MMKFFLCVANYIDALNNRVGKFVSWLTLLVVIVSAVNAVVRKSVGISSNAWLELQWYLFGAIFLLAAGYTYLVNEHVRVDVVAQRFSARTQAWIEVLGVVFFLLPISAFVVYLSVPYFLQSYTTMELSSNTGGLIRWPVKLLIPIGFTLLVLSGLSRLIRVVGFLAHCCDNPIAHKKEPSELAIADDIRKAMQQTEQQRAAHYAGTKGE